MYTVYKHELADKSYIGYTKFDMSYRLQQHYKLAVNGSDCHFHRAIRKYGIDNIKSTILWQGTDHNKAQEMEIHYINIMNTYTEGYNMTKGGDGGWCVPIEKYDDWKQQRSMPLDKNGRWCGFADDEILECARQYFAKNGYNISGFITYSSKEFGMPKSYSKNRFAGKTFKEAYSEKYNIDINEMNYKQTEKHKSNNTTMFAKGSKWYYNETLKVSKQFRPNELSNINEDWIPGRKLQWD